MIVQAPPFLTCRQRDIWKPIPGWPYWVSTTGRIRSTPRVVHARDGRIMRIRAKELKRQMNRAVGYPCIRLSDNRQNQTFWIHDLVASAFIGDRPDRHIINHRDGDKRNCWVGNLEYATRKENARHARDMGLSRRKLTPDNVQSIRRELQDGISRHAVARCYGVTPTMVGRIERGDSWN